MEMSNLVVPGDPVSVLLNHGLPEVLLNMLVRNGVGTVESLGAMTPEQLARIPDMMEEYMTMIQSAVLSYYSQFEAAVLAAQPESRESAPVKSPAHDPLAHLFPSNFGQETESSGEAEAEGASNPEVAPDSSAATDADISASGNVETESVSPVLASTEIQDDARNAETIASEIVSESAETIPESE